MILPGGGFAPGTAQVDRFRCSSETRSAKLHGRHRDMVTSLYQRGRLDMLHARLAGHFRTTELYRAFTRGERAINELMSAVLPPSPAADDDRREYLRDAIEEYRAFNTGRDDSEKPRERCLMHRYVKWVEAEAGAAGTPDYIHYR